MNLSDMPHPEGVPEILDPRQKVLTGKDSMNDWKENWNVWLGQTFFVKVCDGLISRHWEVDVGTSIHKGGVSRLEGPNNDENKFSSLFFDPSKDGFCCCCCFGVTQTKSSFRGYQESLECTVYVKKTFLGTELQRGSRNVSTRVGDFNRPFFVRPRQGRVLVFPSTIRL